MYQYLRDMVTMIKKSVMKLVIAQIFEIDLSIPLFLMIFEIFHYFFQIVSINAVKAR